MSALTSIRDTKAIGQPSEPFAVGVLTATTIYQGALVSKTAAGYAVPGRSTATDIPLGRAKATVVNPGASGAKTVEIQAGVFAWKNSGSNPLTAAHLGKVCYVEDDNSVGSLSSTGAAAGIVRKLDSASGQVFVDMSAPTSAAAVAADSDLGTLALDTGSSLIGTSDSASVQDLIDALKTGSVADHTALGALDTTLIPDGHFVYMVSRDGNFRLRKAATTTVDNQFVFAASPSGRWFSEPAGRNFELIIDAATLQGLSNGVTSYTATFNGDAALPAQAYMIGGGALYHEPFSNGGAATYSIKMGFDYDDDGLLTAFDATVPSATTPGNGVIANIFTGGLGSVKFRLTITSDTDLNQCTSGIADYFGKYMS